MIHYWVNGHFHFNHFTLKSAALIHISQRLSKQIIFLTQTLARYNDCIMMQLDICTHLYAYASFRISLQMAAKLTSVISDRKSISLTARCVPGTLYAQYLQIWQCQASRVEQMSSSWFQQSKHAVVTTLLTRHALDVCIYHSMFRDPCTRRKRTSPDEKRCIWHRMHDPRQTSQTGQCDDVHTHILYMKNVNPVTFSWSFTHSNFSPAISCWQLISMHGRSMGETSNKF